MARPVIFILHRQTKLKQTEIEEHYANFVANYFQYLPFHSDVSVESKTKGNASVHDQCATVSEQTSPTIKHLQEALGDSVKNTKYIILHYTTTQSSSHLRNLFFLFYNTFKSKFYLCPYSHASNILTATM